MLAASEVPQSGMNYAVKSREEHRHGVRPIPRIRAGRFRKAQTTNTKDEKFGDVMESGYTRKF